MEIPEVFQKLFIVVKNMLQSSVVSTRVLAVNILADLSGKVLERLDMVSGGAGPNLAFQVISFVLDQILLLATPEVNIHQAEFAAGLEVKRLLNTLFKLVEKHSYLHCLLLNNICLFIDELKLMKKLERIMETEKTGLSNHEMTEFGNHGNTLIESRIILSMSKIMLACLQNIGETDAETSQVLDAVKLQADNVCHCSYIGSYTSVTYSLVLHLHSTVICMRHMTEDIISLSRKSILSYVDSILRLDKSTLDLANKMLGRNSNWFSYKAGKTAACQGAWSTAAFIFEQLMTVVQSASCSDWLKSLAQLSTSEKQTQLSLFSDQGTSILLGEVNMGEMGVNALRINYCNYMENLLVSCNTLLSAEEILGASDTHYIFGFQRWFLNLRAKALKTFIDVMKLLDTIISIQDGTGSSIPLARGSLLSFATSQTLDPFIGSCMEVSCRMKKLAQEFDLLSTSFMGMDRQSLTSVSALALSCSLMAFTAGFAFLVPNLRSSENYKISKAGSSKEPFHALLIEDLIVRLRHIDCKTRKNLLFLLKPFRSNGCISSTLKTQISSSSFDAIVLHKLCEYSVGEIVSMQKEATRVQRDGNACQILESGSKLLMNVISKLMLFPFRTPQHFFRVRSAVSSDLFVMNEDGQSVDGSSILLGSPLSLSLCYQLKNMPASSPCPHKIYCILKCTPHPQITTKIGECKWQAQLSRHDDEIDDMLDLHKKLLRYVVGSGESHRLQCRSKEDDCLMVVEYACFELNERGQGFSTCFFDVSSLPVGSYRIKWFSSCVDSGGSYWSLLPENPGPCHDLLFKM